MITKRVVFHVGGYDATSPEDGHRRFVRERRHFEAAWSLRATVSEPTVGEDTANWTVLTEGPDWHVETDYRLVRWDDVILAGRRRPTWQRIPLGLFAFADFMIGGAFWGYLRTNWRY